MRFAGVYLRPDLPMDAPYDIIDKLRQYCQSDFFKEFALAAVSRMITGYAIEGARTWREAATKSMRGRMIYEALQQEMQGEVGLTVRELILRNAELISTFPQDIAENITDYINKGYQSGIRAEEMSREIQARFPKIAESRVNLIARTESSKASTALTQARSQSLSLDWYLWRTSKDARVRPSHNRMEGILISWKEPASPERLNHEKRSYGNYAPGNLFFCRCYPEPLIYIDQVSWPHKVYTAGSVRSMTRAAFEKLNSGYVSTYREAA